MNRVSVFTSRRSFRRVWIIATLVLTVLPKISKAEVGLSANLGMSYILEPRAGTFNYQNWSPRFGLESYYLFGKNIELGLFYDQNLLLKVATDDASIKFFGLLITTRSTLNSDDSNLFFYAKGGPTQMVTSTQKSNYAFGIEVGIKYEIPINSSLAARGLLGVGILPSNLVSQDFHMVDSGIFLVVKI